MQSIMDTTVAAHKALDNDVLTKPMAMALALYISEQRQQFPLIVDSYTPNLEQRVIHSTHHSFKVELFSQLAKRPYSIAPLPDGRILVSEKTRGLSVVNQNGIQGDLITGSPQVWEETARVRKGLVGVGWMLEVALHPDFDTNGWVYLSHGDRCQLHCGSLLPVSIVRVILGRIKSGTWVEEQEIWSVHKDYYTVLPDTVAAGRLAFDNEGHVFISVGGKSAYKNLHNMDTPYGKIHRAGDDGTVPKDNPFWVAADTRTESSTKHTIWSYGHRTALYPVSTIWT